MPTPVRVRGRKGNKRLVQESISRSPDALVQIPSTVPRYTSMLEQLPNELLQQILWDSLNLNLSLASPLLASKLNHNGIRRRFVFLAFFVCIINRHLISLPHDRFGLSMDPQFQMTLQCHVIVQPWFSFGLWVSCWQECLVSTLPKAFRKHSKTAGRPKMWHFLEQAMKSHAPEELYNFLENEIPMETDMVPFATEEGSLLDFKSIRFNNNNISMEFHREMLRGLALEVRDHFCTYDFNAETHTKSRISCRIAFAHAHEFTMVNYMWSATDTERIIPDVPGSLLNPLIWTTDNFNTLQLLQPHGSPIIIKTAEQAQDLSEGLTKAISQQFLPAVYLLAKTFGIEQSNSWQCFYVAMSRTMAEVPRNSVLPGCQWLRAWFHCPGSCRHFFGMYEVSPNPLSWESPITIEHLLLAMQIASTPGADLDAYFVFIYLAASLCLSYAMEENILPQSLLSELYAIALEDEAHGKQDKAKGYGMKCYNFLTTTGSEIVSCGRVIDLSD